MSEPVTIVVGEFPQGFCPSTPQEYADGLKLILSGSIDITGVNFGSTEPAAGLRGSPLFPKDANGNPLYPGYFSYSTTYSKWVALHPDFVGKVIMWEGALAAIDALDGGETAAITATTGPFWQAVGVMVDKIPIGAGAVAAINTNASVLTAGAGNPQVRGIEFIRRTARLYRRFP
jgi:hypothetical protein